jgi:uncharacterized protein YndB with AHSA1/START domain
LTSNEKYRKMNLRVKFHIQEGSVAERTIRDEITIDAPPEEIFKALTEADRLEQWLATRVESDATPGGRFKYEFEFDDPAQNNVQEGEYITVDEGSRVELPWVFPFAPKQTTVSYALAPSGEGTRVEFEHAGFEEGESWDGAYERFTGGWRMFLEGLKRYVETGAQGLPFGMKSRGS